MIILSQLSVEKKLTDFALTSYDFLYLKKMKELNLK